ncbi:MAG: hypothetical protein A2687_05290 [Candidatus Levybacteria bacterium RIFCSPHIGHO2_01_FULL_38_26]|nr:MAG: hypothetical protein A2687_05290 [Candidatus Levybacteria bacterium RIFCSPHIGHO2_01_FULL_38_26]
MKKVAFEVALKGKKQIAKGTMAFVFEKPKGFHFRAGQHIRMTLIGPPASPPAEQSEAARETDSEGNSRFFSLANSPQEKELVIALRMRDTAFKRTLRNMQIGDKVRIEILLDSPHGSFAMHDDSSIPAVFLIGGIGIVPAFSMIKDAIERKLPHKIFLFYSNRRPEDAAFLGELKNLAKQNPSFKLISTMTEVQKSAVAWRGETGYIDYEMLKRYVDDLKSPIYYISGLPEMVSSMKTMLTDEGISENNIRAEEFTGFNLNEIQNSTNQNRKSHFALIAVVLVIFVVAVLHFFAASSVFKSGIDTPFLKNPIFYFMIVLILIVIPFKFKHLLGFMNSKRKK